MAETNTTRAVGAADSGSDKRGKASGAVTVRKKPHAPIGSQVRRQASSSSYASSGGGAAGTAVPRHVGDFEMLEWLGRGTFGQVVKVRGRLDGRLYALKRISMPSNDRARERVLREARLLSALNHRNVLRYFSAWVEEGESDLFYDSSTRDVGRGDAAARDVGRGDAAARDESSLLHSDSIWRRAPTSPAVPGKGAGGEAANGGPTNDADVLECQLCAATYQDWEVSWGDWTKLSVNLQPYNLCVSCFRNSLRLMGVDDTKILVVPKTRLPLYLFILTEYCEATLLDELGCLSYDRPGADIVPPLSVTDPEAVWCLFREMVSGLAYVHSKSVIHRDLKPGNIFIVDGHATLGDFGLSRTALRPRGGSRALGGVTEEGAGKAVGTDATHLPLPAAPGLAVLEAIESDGRESETTGTASKSSALVVESKSTAVDGSEEDQTKVQSDPSSGCVVSSPTTGDEVSSAYRSFNSGRHSLEGSDYSDVTGGSGTAFEGSTRKWAFDSRYAYGSATSGDARDVSGEPSSATGHKAAEVAAAAEASLLAQSKGVGTFLYACSEALAGAHSEKTDMFSMGVILFEMWSVFGSYMERVTELTRVKQGIIPPEFERALPLQAKLVRMLVSPDSDKRPSAEQLLDLLDEAHVGCDDMRGRGSISLPVSSTSSGRSVSVLLSRVDSGSHGVAAEVSEEAARGLVAETSALRERVAALEQELADTKAALLASETERGRLEVELASRERGGSGAAADGAGAGAAS